jgi:hypothetical protein
MDEPILVRLKTPMRGAPEDALLPAHVARDLLARGEATDPRDRFGKAIDASVPDPAARAAYKTRAMKART